MASGRRTLVDRLLLHWCQQSAPGEESVAAREPLRTDPRLADELARIGRSLDRLLRRWSNGVLSGDVQLADFRARHHLDVRRRADAVNEIFGQGLLQAVPAHDHGDL